MEIENIKTQPFFSSHSSMKLALNCPRAWFLTYRWGLTLKGGEFTESADLGTIYHKFQQLGFEKQDLVLPWIKKWQSSLLAKIDKGEDLDGQIARTVSALTVSYNKAEAMSRAFWEKYPQPSYLKTIGVEIKHKMDLKFPEAKITIPLEGTIDKLLLDTRNGNIWIRDHKSTGRSLHSLFLGIQWSIQARLYRILAEDYCDKYKKYDTECGKLKAEVVGFILDGILKPGIKLCGKDEKNAKVWDCSLDVAYLRRVKEWYAVKEEENVDSTIKSQSIMFNEPLVPDELKRDLGRLWKISLQGKDPKHYSRDGTRFHCFLYEKPCIFESLCSSPISSWPELLDTKYKIREE